MSKMTDSIDVIIPVYNGEKTIVTAIKSVINQKNVIIGKIIVINDGSTDATALLIQLMKLPNLELITTPNRGVASARNTGIAATNAEWIAFLDADDCWYSDKVANQLMIAKQHKVPFICSAATPNCKKSTGRICFFSLWKGNFITTSSVLMKREIAQEIRPLFSSNMTFAEDYTAWFKILTISPGYFISKNLTQYVVSPQPHYHLGSVFINLILLQKECIFFLLKINIPISKKITGLIVLVSGTTFSILSILKRFIFAYLRSHQSSSTS